LVNKLLGAFNKLISNFNEGSTLELALCILKDNAQLLFNLTIKVVFESFLKSMLMILSGRFICGVLNLGSIFSNGQLSDPCKLKPYGQMNLTKLFGKHLKKISQKQC
jgi:hypothetical protein